MTRRYRSESVQSWQGKNIGAQVLFSRAGVAQHIWIYNGHGSILVDAGDGLLRDLLAHELDTGLIKGLIFTHGHFDHMGGLHALLGFLRMIGRRESLLIGAPDGCIEVFSTVDSFTGCYPDTMPFSISGKRLQPYESLTIAGMEIKAFPVVHHGSVEDSGLLDRIPAMGYRISYSGETIAISGDTGMCPALHELIPGADVAILEATYQNSDGVSEEFLQKVHLTEDVAREIGRTAKSYILVHKGESEDIVT